MAWIIVAMLTGMLGAVGAVMCYRSGLRDGMAVGKGEAPCPALLPFRREKPTVTQEQLRMEQLLKNIDMYDGTEIGQEDL